MSKFYDTKENIMMCADYSDPKPHKHLAAHIIISLGGNMEWNVDRQEVVCRGICIDYEAFHVGKKSKKGSLVFLLTKTNGYGQCLKNKFLNDKKYFILDNKTVDEVCRKYFEIENSRNKVIGDSNITDEQLFEILMNICGLNKNDEHVFDKRIKEILSYIESKKTIDSSIIDELSSHIYLSKSRMSHIFKDETGMTLHSYLALVKLRKTTEYIEQGMNITEASIYAGFDTPSHCAATCKRMFGISLREVYKSIE